MANSVKIFAIVLLMALPLITLGCQVSISQKLSKSKGSSTNTYTATIQNIGSGSASNVQIESSSSLQSISGLTNTHGNTYELPSSVQKKGGIAAGDSYTFTYTIKKSKSVTFTATCTDGEAPCSTMAPTSAPAKATKSPTSAPKKATNAPTTGKAGKATSAPTTAKAGSKATSAPTTAKAGSKATSAPTTAKASTSGSSSNTGSSTTGSSTTYKKCPAGTWWQPSPMTTWQWQLTGTIDQSINVQMYDIDMFDNTADTISQLHAAGRFVICYFSTQYEDWRPDASSWPKSVIGSGLDGWAGENYVDIRSPIVRNIMATRLALAASKGCDGVEPDNVDGYTNSNGFGLTAADQLDFNKFIATTAHANGLSVGLKNDLDQAKSLEPYFDWALDEQCHQYSECDVLKPFTDANKAVFNAEYSGSGSSVCPSMVSAKISSLIKTLDLTAKITAQCCTYASGGCTSAPYTCGSSSGARKRRSLPVEEVEAEVAEEVVAEETFDVAPAQAEPAAAANSAAHATAFSAVVLAVVALAALL